MSEYINNAEILGRVASIRIFDYSGLKVAQMTVMTQHVHPDRGGTPIVENDWHYISAANGGDIHGVEDISKGDIVHIMGRLRTRAYVNRSGEEARLTEVKANQIDILEKGGQVNVAN